MTSREIILSAIKTNMPKLKHLPAIMKTPNALATQDKIVQFQNIITELHGKVVETKTYDEIMQHIDEWQAKQSGKIFNSVSALTNQANSQVQKPHLLEDIDLSIIEGKLGVAENGAIWIEEDSLSHRVVPFICQHLAIVLKKESIVCDMHEAYEQIGLMKTGYGTFISGPSKTADIEQSLVIGAHGPRSLTVYLI